MDPIFVSSSPEGGMENEALHYAQTHFRALLVCPKLSVAEANRKEEKSVHTKR